MQQQSVAQRSPDFPLQINDLLQITIKGTDEEVPTTYMSRVENMSDGDIVIGWPTSRGIRAPLRKDNILCMSFIEGTTVYCIDSRVLRRLNEPIPVIVVRSEGPVRRIQRRDNVRVPAMVDVQLKARVVSANPKGNDGVSANFITTRTLDISGGGFSIYHAACPQVGNLYDVELRLPTLDKPLLLTAKAVRSESVIDPVKGNYFAAGFAFIQIKEAIRRQIVSYVFRFQQNSLCEGS